MSPLDPVRPVRRAFRSTWPLWLFIAIFALGMLLVAWDHYSPAAAQIQEELADDLQVIPPVPGAQLVSQNAAHKRTTAYAYDHYFTDLSYPEIRAYYDAELARLGWRFELERSVKVQGTDIEEKFAVYCRPDRTASICFAGEIGRYTWTYSLSESWGSPCPR